MITPAITAFSKEVTALLPYIEGDGYADRMLHSPVIGWMSPTKIIYSVNSRETDNSYSGVWTKYGNDFVTTKQVNILNLVTKKTSPYKKGQLVNYENGEITIRQYAIRNNNDYKTTVLKGLLDSNSLKTVIETNNERHANSPFDACPHDTSNKSDYHAMFLKSDHGCVHVPDSYAKDKRWIFYRADGLSIELMNTPEEYFWRGSYWIDWLGAYVLGDTIMGNKSGTILASAAKMKLLTPSGMFKLVDIDVNTWSAEHARPTRAGVVAAINTNKNIFLQPLGGLRLWRDGQVYKITEGKVMATSLAPDGCKVAYLAYVSGLISFFDKTKLRVIDVCEAFKVAKDANPYDL